MIVSQAGELALEEVMTHELSAFPPALFEENDILRQADKPQLAHAISDFASDAMLDSEPRTDSFVLDGGSLLQRLQWMHGETYGEIVRKYSNFILQQYGERATIVFDGYENGPSIKDNAHCRRARKGMSPCINFTEGSQFTGRKDNFLANSINKQMFISMLSNDLRTQHVSVINATGDADVDIAKCATELACDNSTTVIGEDTDLLVLLLYYVQDESKTLYFRSDKAKYTRKAATYHINGLRRLLGFEMCQQLLFLHAFTGCDTTLRIYGIGKKAIFQRLVKKDQQLQRIANQFIAINQSSQQITELASDAMVTLFGGKCSDSLSIMRSDIFRKKVATSSTHVTPEKLPPTKSAAEYHGRRVYYQIMTWMSTSKFMNPIDWGWTQKDEKLIPIMTDLQAAPDNLLKIIHCNCSTACQTLRCSCRRYSMACTSVCGPCQIKHCLNPKNKLTHAEVEDDVEE